MSKPDDPFCYHALQAILDIGDGMMALHGRRVYNSYALYGYELQRDIRDLINQKAMHADLRPRSMKDTIFLPALSYENIRRMRVMWDYFVFIYMSHKMQNIKRRQITAKSLDLKTILYLRGTDYEFAISRGRAAVGSSTTQDMLFEHSIVRELSESFNITKALSPSDLKWAMAEIGPFLASHGNNLSWVAEFARLYDGGIFLNPSNWRTRFLDLIPSASSFLVYVSNQSNGLKFELEMLSSQGLEAHTILVLDDSRFGSREMFFATQERLKEAGENLYLSVARDTCAVEDPDAFERLVSSFPHTLPLNEDTSQLLSDIAALIPSVCRPEAASPTEVPFEFRAILEPAAKANVADLERHVREVLQESLSSGAISNWPVLLLHIELDVFLNLAQGRLLEAGLSVARIAAVADFMRAFVRQRAPERISDLDSVLEQCGTIAKNTASDVFAMGEWNDYSDRTALVKNHMDETAKDIIELMQRSVSNAATILMREMKPELSKSDPSAYSDMVSGIFDATLQSKRDTD